MTKSNKEVSELLDPLAAIQARYAINDLLDEYCLAMDLRDRERWLGIWHDDGIFDVDYPRQVCRGHSEILGWIEQVWQSFDILNHFSANHRIVMVDADHATGVSHASAMHIMTDGSYVVGAANYRDTYERRDGCWRIAYRKVLVNHLAKLPDVQVLLRADQNAEIIDFQ